MRNLHLIINNEEYDFDKKISFNLHPTNSNSITFNKVIRKVDNVYPKNVTNPKIPNTYSLAQVYDENNLIFFGIVNATGRFSLMPNEIKTFSVEVVDVRKWLSILKPVNLIFYDASPLDIIVNMLSELNENILQIGEIHFTNDKRIKAYSLMNKTPYQILKEVIAPITNSYLYFTVKKNKLLINFKSWDDFNNNHIFTFDINNHKFLEENQILSINYENNNEGYANIINYSSDNIVSNKPKIEEIKLADTIEYSLLNNVYNWEYTNCYIYDPLNPLSSKQNVKFAIEDNENILVYDVMWSRDSNTIKVREGLLNQNLTLHLEYYIKTYWSITLTDNDEVSKVANLTNTKGEVYLGDKFNDLLYSEDLLRKTTHKLSIAAKPRHTLIIESRKPLFKILDNIDVVTNNDEINGSYVCHTIQGDFEANNKMIFGVYTYTLKQTLDFDDFTNLFDNQSYRTNFNEDIEDENANITINENVSIKVDLISDLEEDYIEEIDSTILYQNLQNPLQTPLTPYSPNIKYDLIIIKEGN